MRSSSHSQQSLIWLLSEFGSRMEFNADGDDSFVDVDVSSSSGLCEHSTGAKVETKAWEAITPISVEVPFEKQD